MTSHGFKVTKHYLGLDTAWRAEFTRGTGGRVLGVNSEMDALPGIGHACGHNLIAISGVGVALAVKAALEAHNVSGKVVLLGTPAEEGGMGKVLLIENGGYKDMDACIMQVSPVQLMKHVMTPYLLGVTPAQVLLTLLVLDRLLLSKSLLLSSTDTRKPNL
jgi:metal-dependent amidase/aminoacylase/carboxypeptidase family protein